MHLVIYVSRTLSLAEQRYSNRKRETLAILFVVKRLKDFLLDRKLKTETDCRPMEFIIDPNEELPKTVSARIRKWAISPMVLNLRSNSKSVF